MEEAPAMVECPFCGELIGEEDDGYCVEHRGRLVDICYGCYQYYEYECVRCGERTYDSTGDVQHAMVVVLDARATGVGRGVYRVVELPYFRQSIIGGGRLWGNCLSRLMGVPEVRDDEYPCGHLCPECQEWVLSQAIAAGLRMPERKEN